MSKVVKRILIAEDTPQWQKYHESLLRSYEKLHLEFYIASNAKEALEQAQNSVSTPYDIILSDLQMESDFLPMMAGEWFVRQIKNIPAYVKTPVIIISAAYNIAFIAHTLSAGYLSKRSIVNNPDSYYLMLDENLL